MRISFGNLSKSSFVRTRLEIADDGSSEAIFRFSIK